MSDITLLTGAAVFAAGMVTGRVWPARRRKPKPVQPVCGCDHHYSFHDPQTGACGYGLRHLDGYDRRDNPIYSHTQCPCLKYSGPEPLPEYYAPEIESSA